MRKTAIVALAGLAVVAAVWLTGRAAPQTLGTKFGKYIVTEPAPPTPGEPAGNVDAPPADMLTPMTYLDGIVVPGAYYTECSWLWKAYPDRVWVKEHVHDFDEIFGFYGTDPENPKDLCGEIELWIGGERHTLTKSCLVFVPRGVKHCPLTIKRLDRPVFMFTSGPSPKYKG
ncbi:MAG TPA: hypothetical protein PLP83_05715 [Candidatus Aminicenantes bacterium]|nr:hypothetical protein [Candidatus Aminicenantes bacterium]